MVSKIAWSRSAKLRVQLQGKLVGTYSSEGRNEKLLICLFSLKVKCISF